MSVLTSHDIASPVPSRTVAGSDEFYMKFTVGAAVFFGVFGIAYFGLSGLPSFDKPSLDAFEDAFGRDFLNTYMGAMSALNGGPAAWFDLATYNQAVRDFVGQPMLDRNWSYPPHILLFIWPLGFLPYTPAFVAWLAIGLAVFMFAASRDLSSKHFLFLAVAPAVAINFFTGNNGLFTAALLIGGLSVMDRRPILAGILFGILTIKPQLGLLLPLMLMLTGRWRCIFAAAATTLVLVGLTAAIYGVEIWTEFFAKALPIQRGILTHGGGLFPVMMPTAFMNARLAHLPLEAAWAIQGAVSAFAVAAVVWTFSRRRDPVLSLALFVTASFLVTPYGFNYDMVTFSWVVALLRERADNAAWDHRLAIAVWTLPVTVMLLGAVDIPLSCLILIAFAARLLWRLKAAQPVAAVGCHSGARVLAGAP